MSETAHTPGLWTSIEPKPVHRGFFAAGDSAKIFAGSNLIAAVPVHTDNWKANARLIAAAPDMKSDGQFLLDRLDEFERDGLSGYGEREWIGHVSPAIARFRAAIAKAEGRS